MWTVRGTSKSVPSASRKIEGQTNDRALPKSYSKLVSNSGFKPDSGLQCPLCSLWLYRALLLCCSNYPSMPLSLPGAQAQALGTKDRVLKGLQGLKGPWRSLTRLCPSQRLSSNSSLWELLSECRDCPALGGRG